MVVYRGGVQVGAVQPGYTSSLPVHLPCTPCYPAASCPSRCPRQPSGCRPPPGWSPGLAASLVAGLRTTSETTLGNLDSSSGLLLGPSWEAWIPPLRRSWDHPRKPRNRHFYRFCHFCAKRAESSPLPPLSLSDGIGPGTRSRQGSLGGVARAREARMTRK